MSERIVQIQSSSISQGQILYGVKNQMLIGLSSIVISVFRIQKELGIIQTLRNA